MVINICMFIDAFTYCRCYQVIFTNGQYVPCLDNTSMKKRTIKLHRGVDNSLYFRILNPDYKAQDVSPLMIKALLYNYETNEKIYEGYLTQTTIKGKLFLQIYEGDLVDIVPGMYQLLLQAEDHTYSNTPGLYSASPFYTDTNDDVSFAVEVVGAPSALPFPTIEVFPSTWLPIALTPGNDQIAYLSSAIPANAIRNHRNSVHTFAIYGNNFTGSIQLLGSLNLNPPEDPTLYFPIELTNGYDIINYSQFSGVDPFTFKANIMWVKFKLMYTNSVQPQDQGTVTKILWRS